MIPYTDFMSKVDAHRKAGNKVVDHKYTKDKAHYTVIDKEGDARKVTHTPGKQKQEKLDNVKGDDDKVTTTAPAVKRGRGRPAGTKSGARRHN